MSLAIRPKKVVRVLLADGWHGVEAFHIDAYEFVSEVERDGWTDCPTEYGDGAGFSCTERWGPDDDIGNGFTLSGPMSSILAVREMPR